MDNDLVEKVARAICFVNFFPDDVLAEDQGGGPTWTLYTSEATAAIHVVLEEAAAMIDAKFSFGVGRYYSAAIRDMMPKEDV